MEMLGRGVSTAFPPESEVALLADGVAALSDRDSNRFLILRQSRRCLKRNGRGPRRPAQLRLGPRRDRVQESAEAVAATQEGGDGGTWKESHVPLFLLLRSVPLLNGFSPSFWE